jgi:intracellular septation protein
LSPQLRAALLGGLLPVAAFTVIEEWKGPVAGLVAGMAFGLGELAWEWRRQGKVSGITWAANGMILALGSVSLLTQEGMGFKLQPALIEGAVALALWGSAVAGRPLLGTLMEAAWRKQGVRVDPARAEWLRRALRGMNARAGAFFAVHAGLAAWAALRWSTGAWALLKGVGFNVSLLAYFGAEALWLRRGARAAAGARGG